MAVGNGDQVRTNNLVQGSNNMQTLPQEAPFFVYGTNENQKTETYLIEPAIPFQEMKAYEVASKKADFKEFARKEINESKGAASKPVASTKSEKEVITESSDLRDRFKKLANLI